MCFPDIFRLRVYFDNLLEYILVFLKPETSSPNHYVSNVPTYTKKLLFNFKVFQKLPHQVSNTLKIINQGVLTTKSSKIIIFDFKTT